MKAFVEITGLIVRVGPETDHYGASFDFAYVGIGSGGKLEIKGLNGRGGTKAHYDAGIAALLPLGFSEITYERTDHRGSRSFVPTLGANGDLIMGKTNDAMKSVHAHDHMHTDAKAASAAGNKVPGNLINQQTAGATIDAMRELHKAGKSEIVEATTGEFVTSSGLKGYQTLLRAVPVAD